MANIDDLSTGLKQAFIQLIAKQTGIKIRERDRDALSENIFLRMKALQVAFPEDYYQLLNSKTLDSQQEWQKLVVLLTNLESYFFRDKEQFYLLQSKILPDIIERKQANKTIRICSAGCSTGEEPYSLAILLKEILPNLEQWNLLVLGLDINKEALQKAKIGTYRAWSFRNVDKLIKQRYFQIINDYYHIAPQIKPFVKFQILNLVNDPFPHPSSDLQDFDLILCRNVFIYFEPPAIAQVLDKFYHALQPLGYLLTGHSELYGQTLNQFQTNVFPESLVYQRREDSLGYPYQVSFPNNLTGYLEENLSLDMNRTTLERDLEKNNLKMQQSALNLLKQLPADTKLPKLGNLTAAELILQLESSLNAINPDSL
ncbi:MULTISPECIES: CheR family methyltransferase [unclassified Coleofasciculus]|uniref:CheR family methyltransferase n=1 Tax=unclassified Coleofasciculus TaxID=2692782 RepID=UPI00187DF3DC|nr:MULTISPECIES: protein-glutamate O-methyltransferase CheR [unclassified Coleofasciculus]MBE9125620.1 protein-glutamate O-methyltransferase CheR [Coleofasciculus sp. LEGE 07081]MBE9147334.1 protein-glutamate O-methyltransferase CheR [Coleofasciculus sp. LEGE 07092]